MFAPKGGDKLKVNLRICKDLERES